MGAGDHAIAVLAGGTSRRLGRDKLDLRRDGRTLLEHVLDGLPTPWPAEVIVVGPHRELPERLLSVRFAREQPEGGGPLAAIEAAVLATSAPVIVVLAGDSPAAGAAVAPLLAVVTGETSAVLHPPDRRPNPLTAAYARDPLMQALAKLRPTQNGRARDLLDLLPWIEVPAAIGADDDVDTASDAERLGFD